MTASMGPLHFLDVFYIMYNFYYNSIHVRNMQRARRGKDNRMDIDEIIQLVRQLDPVALVLLSRLLDQLEGLPERQTPGTGPGSEGNGDA